MLHADARALYDGLTSGVGLACVLVSAAAGVGLALVWRERYVAARFAAAATSPRSPSAGHSPSTPISSSPAG